MLLTILTLLIALAPPTLAPTASTSASADDPFAGLYACAPNHGTYVFWLGVRDGDRLFQRIEVLWPEDYPYGTAIRNHGGSAYSVRGSSFSTLAGGVDFEGSTLQYDGAACEQVQTFADLLRAFGLEPDDAVQEVMDIEGWAREQAEARLDDPAFALAAFHGSNPWPRESRLGPPSVAQILVGATLPAPPPPPNAAPADLPQGSDAFAGIYVDGGSTPRIHLIRDGRYVQFSREYNSKRFPPYGYAYEFEDGYDYRVRGGAFSYQYTDLEFQRDGDRTVMLTYRGRDARRVYTLRQLIEENDFDPATMVTYLVGERGMTEAEANALLDDAAAFDAAVRGGPERLLFADLLGL